MYYNICHKNHVKLDKNFLFRHETKESVSNTIAHETIIVSFIEAFISATINFIWDAERFEVTERLFILNFVNIFLAY